MAKRILVIDDEKDLTLILSTKLSQLGYETETANSTSEASQLLSDGEFDLILSDVRMPGGSGIELLKNIRKSGLSTPLVLLSGYTDITIKEALHLGASDLMTKPVDFVHLDKTVSKCLMQREELWKDMLHLTKRPEVTIKTSFEDSEFGEVFRMGHGGFSLVVKDPPSFTDDSGVNFQVSYAGKTISGCGRIRWREIHGDSAHLGIEIDALDEGKELVFQMNDSYPSSSFIPEL